MIRRILYTIVLAMAALTAMSQNICYGTVTNEQGEPMPYATVFIESLKQSAICDANGYYQLSSLPTSRLSLRASCIGFHTEELEVMVQGNTRVDFRLKEQVVSLNEMIILPKGMDISTYVMQQLEKNRKPLKKRISYYECRNTARMEKHIDLSELRKRKTIRFALMLAGWGKNFDTMVKYKDLTVTMAEDLKFNKGKITNSKLQILSTNPKLTDSELKSFSKKDWFLDDNSYDRFYDEMHKKIKSLRARNPKYKLTFHGSYDEGNRTIYIMRYGSTQVEVVSDCWQIRRMQYKSSSRTMTFEFQELSPGVFLPVSGHAEYNLHYSGYPHGTVKLSMAYKYRNVRK